MITKKYEAWHWKVITIDGNDPDAIRTALTEAKAVTGQPTLIIGKTIMGKGARKADDSSYERNCATHGAPLGYYTRVYKFHLQGRSNLLRSCSNARHLF